MIAIKNWFLVKNHLAGFRNKELEVVKETEKAMLLRTYVTDGFRKDMIQEWFPKSVIIDEWEKDTSNFGYHDYLVEIYHKAYNEGIIENTTIKSGRNVYRGDNFVHQWRTAELVKELTARNIPFMNREEWNNR